MSSYELRKDPKTGVTRLEVKGTAEMYSPELRGDVVGDVIEPVLKTCPSCGLRYTASDLEKLLDDTGSDTNCADCETELIDAEDREVS